MVNIRENVLYLLVNIFLYGTGNIRIAVGNRRSIFIRNIISVPAHSLQKIDNAFYKLGFLQNTHSRTSKTRGSFSQQILQSRPQVLKVEFSFLGILVFANSVKTIVQRFHKFKHKLVILTENRKLPCVEIDDKAVNGNAVLIMRESVFLPELLLNNVHCRGLTRSPVTVNGNGHGSFAAGDEICDTLIFPVHPEKIRILSLVRKARSHKKTPFKVNIVIIFCQQSKHFSAAAGSHLP